MEPMAATHGIAGPPVSLQGPTPNQRSCQKCNQRKTRCSKTSPCESCVKLGVECVFPPPGRAARKKKRPLKAELVSQMKDLEQKLHDLGQERAGDSGISMSNERDPNLCDTSGPATRDLPISELETPSLNTSSKDIKANRESNLGQLLVERDTYRYVSHQGLVSIENGVFLPSVF